MDTQQLSINKTAETQTDVHPIIKKRWSPLAFSDKQIGAPEMATLFEAASWAASAFNEQVEYDGEIHSAANLYDALKEGYYGKL